MPFATQRDVDRLMLEPAQRERFEFDAKSRGLSIRIQPGGKHSWTVWYTSPVTSKRARVTLGSVAAIRLSDARGKAADVLAAVRNGRDPGQERRQARAMAAGELTLQDLLARYRRDYCERELRSNTLRMTDNAIVKWQPLHRLPAVSVTRGDVARVLLDLRREVGAVTANRAHSVLSAAYAWAMSEMLLDANPAVGIKRSRETSRDRVLSEQELGELWRATGERTAFHRIIRLLMLTGARRSEVGGMTWAEVDVDRALWTIPAERMKGGERHEVPLSDQALEVIPQLSADLPEVGKHAFIFGARGKPFADWSRAKRDLDAKLELEPWTLHDIRRSVVSHMSDLGLAEPHVIEAIVGHRVKGVAAIYNRATHMAARRQALQAWANVLVKL